MMSHEHLLHDILDELNRQKEKTNFVDTYDHLGQLSDRLQAFMGELNDCPKNTFLQIQIGSSFTHQNTVVGDPEAASWIFKAAALLSQANKRRE